MKVVNILRKRGGKYHSIAPDQSLADAVALMMQHRIGSLVVMEGARLVSIVTERDVMRAVHEHRENFSQVKVRDAMAPSLVLCKEVCTLDEAMEKMFTNETGQRIRHLPIVAETGEVLGVISIGDIVEALLTEVRFENKLLKHYIKNWPEPED